MKIRALHLTPQTWDAHEADLERLERVVGSVLQRFGVFAPFEGGEEWTVERADERLLRQGPLHPLVHAVTRAMRCVVRSYHSVASAREDTIGHLVDLREVLKSVHRVVGRYEKERPGEVATERKLDDAVGCETVHSAERELFIAAKVSRWRCAIKAAWRETTELVRALQGERPGIVEAGLYDAKGAGMATEFALRLMEIGMHPKDVAILRQDANVYDATLKSRAQKAEVRQQGDAVRRAVVRAVERIRSTLQEKSADVIT